MLGLDGSAKWWSAGMCVGREGGVSCLNVVCSNVLWFLWVVAVKGGFDSAVLHFEPWVLESAFSYNQRDTLVSCIHQSGEP